MVTSACADEQVDGITRFTPITTSLPVSLEHTSRERATRAVFKIQSREADNVAHPFLCEEWLGERLFSSIASIGQRNPVNSIVFITSSGCVRMSRATHSLPFMGCFTYFSPNRMEVALKWFQCFADCNHFRG